MHIDAPHFSLIQPFTQSTEYQKACLIAVCNGTNDSGRRHLILSLQLLVEAEGNLDDRAQTLSNLGTILGLFNESSEQVTNVSQLITELAGLSVQSTREMLALAEAQRFCPTEIVVLNDREHDVSTLTSPVSHAALATASGTATTAPSTAESNCDDDDGAASS